MVEVEGILAAEASPLCRVSSSDMRVYKINQIPDWLEQTKWERLGGYVLLSASLCVWLIISENRDKSQSIYWKRSIWTANLAEENITEHFTGSSCSCSGRTNNSWFLSRLFFQSACDVPEPEEKFNIDEYSDMVNLSKPIIYISIEEIINTHSVNPSKMIKILPATPEDIIKLYMIHT